jgi:hypothetical protein
MNPVFIPFAAEVEEARFALQRDEEQLRRIESESVSSGILAETDVQQEKQYALQSRIFANRARISPVRLLPTELLQRIFKTCLPDERYIIPRTSSAPLLFRQICRHWRHVAEATSELWSSIKIQDMGISTAESYTAMVTRWLAASSTRPLAIGVICLQEFERARSRLSQSGILRLLISHSAHLHDLHIQANYLYIDEFITGGSPAVKHFLIHVMSMMSYNNSLLPLCTSNITNLGLRGQQALALIPPAAFPQITHLTLDSFQEEVDFMKILSDFPALVVLKTKLSIGRGGLTVIPPDFDAEPMEHCTLEVLTIYLAQDLVKFGDVTPLARTFDSLSLPSLRELNFFALDSYREASVDQWLPDSVKALFDRSSCSAKRLLYCNFKPPVDMNVLGEQLKSVAVDLRVDNISFDCPWYTLAP